MTVLVRTILILATATLSSAAWSQVDPGQELLAASASVADVPAIGDAHVVGGQEYEINDLRLRAGFLPDKVDASGNSGNWDHNYSIGVLAMRAPHALSQAGGFVWGGEGSLNTASRNVSGDRTSTVGVMADIMVGWAYRLGSLPNLHFEGTPFFGVGVDHFKDDIGGSPTAFAYEYGLRVAGYWTFTNLWQAGLDLRLQATKTHPEFGGSVGGVNITTKGVAVLFTVGRRF